jgi:beta-1,4-mannosyltransferase
MALIVGNWPGPEFDPTYVGRFCDGLTKFGLRAESVSHPLKAVTQKLDILHIHWPESVFWKSGRIKGTWLALSALLGLLLLRLNRVKLVWCIHNLEPHESGGRTFKLFWNFYIRVLTSLLHGFVTLSPSTVQLARDAFPSLTKKPGTFIWHHNYPIEATRFNPESWRARHDIEPNSVVFAFIGQIRPYKGIEELLDCFSRITATSIRLVIAGSPFDENIRQFLESAASADRRVLLKLGRLSDDELTATVLAANAIVLPFRKTFHSGTIVYALSCDRPVITPVTAYATDLRNQIGSEWIEVYEGALTTNHLENFKALSGLRPDLAFLSIDISAPKIKAFYLSLLNNTAQTA